MIINGKQVSREVLEKLKEDVKALRQGLDGEISRIAQDSPLRFAAVLASNNPGIRKFLELKGKAAREIGIDYDIYEFPETISEDQLKREVKKIAQDKDNNGVLVELPLPKGINAQNVLNEISPEKDVDVLSQVSQEKFYSNNSPILPPSVEAVKTVLEFYNFNLKGPDTKGIEDPRFANYALRTANRDKKAIVFGHGLLVGKPVAHWLAQNGAQVAVIDEHTKDPQKHSIEADIIVSGVGKPGLITGDMVKSGVVAIDFGYENKEGRMVGDFKFDEVSKKASLITPVPGGIGPVVIAAVLKNLVKLNL